MADGVGEDFGGEVGRLSVQLQSVPLELDKTVEQLLELILLHAGF